MRILHTADWHLGKKLYDFSRIEEQRAVLEEICQIADSENADAIVIAGDLYDTFNPPTEATELFYQVLNKLAKNGTRPVIAIAGNHDSADRIEAPDPLAKVCGILFSGFPNTEIKPFRLESGVEITQSDLGFIELQLPNFSYPLRVLLTPYANEARLKSFLGTEDTETELRSQLAENWKQLADRYCNSEGVNILVSHLFMMKKGGTKLEEPSDERPILHIGGAQAIHTENIPSQIQYTALGHLHRQHSVEGHSGEVVYSGSLLEYSFSEANQQKYVMIVDLEPNQPAKIERIPLTEGKKLARKRFEELETALEWLSSNQDSFVEMTLVSDNFLEASVKKQLMNVHDGIMVIIPEIRKQDSESTQSNQIDLTQSREALFEEYFLHKNGQKPNEEIMGLFKEITRGN
ncbi:MAG: exonuclease SbcD [Bacteroidia bacterium]|jgi:exonuclease SbcD